MPPRCDIRQAAELAGAKRYFTGKPCKHGHISERYISGACVECSVLKNKEQAAANPEALKAYKKAYYRVNSDIAKARTKAWAAANPERAKARSEAWVAANPERLAARNKAYREANAERIAARNKAWVSANPERVRKVNDAWRAANPERVAAYKTAWRAANSEWAKSVAKAYQHRRRAQKAGGMTGAEQYDWENTQAKVCFWCDIDCADNYHVDHIMPLAKGGLHVAANLVIACPSCNHRKSAKLPEDFLEELLRGTDQ